jgi:hypothetical protein
LRSPAGWYSISGSTWNGGSMLYAFMFDGPAAFSSNIVNLPDGTGTVDPLELRTPAHYSVAYNETYAEWGGEPWVWGSDFYQTFVATHPHVTRIATNLAGKSGDHAAMTLNFGIYRVNAGPPSTWTPVSPVRSYYVAGGVDPIIHVFWVAFRSSEVNLSVGQTYAVRMWDAPGSAATTFAIVARPDTGNGYAAGMLYSGDVALPAWDGWFYVSGGSTGTLVNHAPWVNFGLNTLAGWTTRFGQTFRATGTSLASAECVYTTGVDAAPALNIEFQVYDHPGGAPIGPKKTGTGLSGFYQARASVGWLEGEVPLTPGQTYYIEWTPPAGGCNTWFMSDNVPGEAYVNGVSKAPNDLMMPLAEYLPNGPTITLSTDRLARSVEQGGHLDADTFTVRNTGTGSISYCISDDADWLTVAPACDSSSGAERTATASYHLAGLAPGQYAATISIADPGAINSPMSIAVSLEVRGHAGDLDLDGDVDLEDFGAFQACYSGPGIAQEDPACARALLDVDTDVDGTDANIFSGCLSGPGTPATAGCAG